jgi:uncharacterized protein
MDHNGIIRWICILSLAVALLLAGACRLFPGLTPTPQASMTNPASALCEREGGKLEIRTQADGGQYGVCVFPGGQECEEWSYFRGECQPEMQGPAVQSAVSVLAERLNLRADTIRVIGVEARVWGDLCLGLAAPEEACAEVITPGWVVRLGAGGVEYTLHVDSSGREVRQAAP